MAGAGVVELPCPFGGFALPAGPPLVTVTAGLDASGIVPDDLAGQIRGRIQLILAHLAGEILQRNLYRINAPTLEDLAHS